MKRAIELRYSVLTSLATLLWLLCEFVLGFQDKYLDIYPVVTACSLIVPVLCYRRAFIEKAAALGRKLTLNRAFITAFLLALFTAIFSIPIEIFFLKVVNPDYMADMIQYTAGQSKQLPEAIAVYINLQSLVAENVIFTFVTSLAIGVILAFRFRVNS